MGQQYNNTKVGGITVPMRSPISWMRNTPPPQNTILQKNPKKASFQQLSTTSICLSTSKLIDRGRPAESRRNEFETFLELLKNLLKASSTL